MISLFALSLSSSDCCAIQTIFVGVTASLRLSPLDNEQSAASGPCQWRLAVYLDH